MSELFVYGAEDEHGPHRRCTGHVTGTENEIVLCPLRATHVVGDSRRLVYFACAEHRGNASSAEPIGEFFEYIRVSTLAQEAQDALAACVEPT